MSENIFEEELERLEELDELHPASVMMLMMLNNVSNIANIDEEELCKFITREKRVDDFLDKALSVAFNTEKGFWLELQAEYDKKRKEYENEKPIIC